MIILKEMLQIIRMLISLVISVCECLFKTIIPTRKKDLHGKTVLITGGGGCLGKELAISFAKCGARIILWDSDKELNEQSASLVTALNLEAYAYTCDCSNETEVKEAANKIQQEIGQIDIIINNAAIMHARNIIDLKESDIRRSFDVNVLSYFWVIKAFLPSMMEQNEGHIVTISSSAGLNGTAYLTDYSATKFAVVGLHESLALELRELGFYDIQMTCVCPNFVNTGLAWYPKTNVPWLIPILKSEEVAEEIVDAVREDQEMLVLPKRLGKILSTKRLFPLRSQLAVYDYLGVGVEPHIRRRKTKGSVFKSN